MYTYVLNTIEMKICSEFIIFVRETMSKQTELIVQQLFIVEVVKTTRISNRQAKGIAHI